MLPLKWPANGAVEVANVVLGTADLPNAEEDGAALAADANAERVAALVATASVLPIEPIPSRSPSSSSVMARPEPPAAETGAGAGADAVA